MEKDKEITHCISYDDKVYTLADMEKRIMSGEFGDHDYIPAYNAAGECLRWISGKYIKQMVDDQQRDSK